MVIDRLSRNCNIYVIFAVYLMAITSSNINYNNEKKECNHLADAFGDLYNV